MKWLLAALLATTLAGCTGASEPDNLVIGNASSFAHGDLTINVGETVTFEMRQASHTVDFSEGEGDVPGVSNAHSGNLDEGDSWTTTFTEPGTYPYFCRYHSAISNGERVGMVGTITVV